MVLVALVAFIVVGGLVGWLVERAQDGRAARQPFVVSAADQSPAGAVSQAAARVGPAVVRIDPTPGQTPQDERGEARAPETGSGVIINPAKGYVVTNSHVIRGASNPRVTLPDGRSFRGRVLGTDPVTNLAVLRIEGQKLPWAPLGSSGDLRVGAWVLVIGNPYGFENSVSVGVVSAKQRNLGFTLADLIQTDAAINEGNSGGAMVNLQGEVVGIAMSALPEAHGIGFAVASDLVKEIVPQLIAQGKVVRPWIGIQYQEINPDLAAEANLPVEKGLLVVGVMASTPAQKAGLQNGDIITAAAGRTTTEADDLRVTLRDRKPGDKFTLGVLRDGEPLTVTLTLGEMPTDGPAPAEEEQP